MKYFPLIIIFLFFSCGKKQDVLLPKSNVTIVKDVQDHSPIYIFFKVEGKDTIADLNRKSAIISTNWIFNIDKRLPLKLVIPQVIKMQEKKRADSAHKNENAENYYSYADSIGKNLAFLPFTKVYYKTEKPKDFESFFYFKEGGKIQFGNTNKDDFPKYELQAFLTNLRTDRMSIIFSYDKKMSYEDYIQCKILVNQLKFEKKEIKINHEKEFIF